MQNPRHTSIQLRPVSILGSGHSLPARIVTSSALDATLELAVGSVTRITGVERRHVAASSDTAASLGAEAARRALEAASLELHQIDLVACASGTMDQGMPCNAALIHRELGLGNSGVPAIDIGASCLGFIAALDTLSWPLTAGHYRHILLVCSDIASCGLDWKQVEVSGIFGDGAAAVVLGLSDDGPKILASVLRTFSVGSELCEIRAGGSRYHPRRIDVPFESLTSFSMQGKGVFRLAATHLPPLVDDLLNQAGMTQSEIDWIIPHQASQQALQHATKRLGFASEKVINIFAHHGNQIAASIPTALDIAIKDSRVQRGQRLMLIGTGAGLSLGGMILEF
ncbi:beta-ketoacyl-ACP synthase 3 [Pseudomonas sp. CCI3.2]|uniref:beta-ketoacyl-ACP synthase 3 n=1 Tax=unclassified Pseudomonas TaxID=196821 RepID=UPI002AC8C4E6|nr:MULTISPECIES: beta-ketoacyl-ACP synthase 3 [unclassified Pseudomonas]MEB0079638.1 beta-ketoacyl-ACP synthase 3 [Pseudomonas sp. MH10out]MEB0103428.1 beta-ketoacyl-ACP synthase 3 [Pseudomonas sp. CCI3.2]MEB0132219.1 beta-ketoacyl-ACP synthase 3 [Pseudomonas sp. CCI2.4]MEB0157819.1 beta-ketoacyl-ACP synthase 3 [Pseudomonas sp. AH2 (2023)]MEB0169334.1 beta-ketoacyl-ACP synthase 3 [Pseudomonas sp. CCC4.4]